MIVNKKISQLERMSYRYYKIVHAIRMAIAFTLTFTMLRIFFPAGDNWPLVIMVTIMGPFSYWGNVMSRAIQRCGGTIIGAIVGLCALLIEHYSLALMTVWCSLAMFAGGYLALGKRPYMGLLIGITLCAVTGTATDHIEEALIRSSEAIIGSLLALIFTSIFPQKAFIHWNILMFETLNMRTAIYRADISPNVVVRPDLSKLRGTVIDNIDRINSLGDASHKEINVDIRTFEIIHREFEKTFNMLDLMSDSYWRNDQCRIDMLNDNKLKKHQKQIINMLHEVSMLMYFVNESNESNHHGNLEANSESLSHRDNKDDITADKKNPISNYDHLTNNIFHQIESLKSSLHLVL
ncbi:FUSC family protein [Salmonella enterica subsp. enterica serovar Montevideo]|nr:FUSC family protein [Salmonella enterica subsp. enterica serovar Montevideo]EEK7814079.1 FUSC family protein [Salmonella enterica subsp. enterica serovar Montevideo]